ncbi:hypothetical protein C8E95_3422 [Pseudonocardia autotrophica]|uniref:Uncharacterized protein n=1 Tax=Pseudonocardia autotrophica TaxID=2074 RepID=A0A1Y2N930_PSEAH|nr:hypothetical protein BG845_00083 [Pseudonocardia autotrophica]TDN74304.1 hypothetical protein C8E95_3422 [Pseudonocardia autotrophica]
MRPSRAAQRPTRVVPGPGVPQGTPPGGHPQTRAYPGGPGAAGPGGPHGPVGGGPGGGGGTGGTGDGKEPAGGETSSLKADLSPTKIAAGAGAAVVTAILGSFLGAVGTVIGAALGSIISTLATTLFTRSIEVSKEKAVELAKKGTVIAAREPGGRPVAGPTGEETVLLDPAQAPGRTQRAASDAKPGRIRRVRLTRKTMIVSAVIGVVTFAVSMFLITGFEFLKGSPIGGGGEGTSIGRAVGGPPPQETTEQDDGTGSGDTDSTGSETSTSESESSTSTSESTESTGTSEPGQQGSSGSDQGGSLQDRLNRVLPTEQPESGRQQSGQDGGNTGGGNTGGNN